MRFVILAAVLGLSACSAMAEPQIPTSEQIDRAALLAQHLAEIARQIGGGR